jgi:tetratricopeptide (TPR) repeat protein
VYFYAMSLIEGRTLAEVIAGLRKAESVNSRPLSVAETADLPAKNLDQWTADTQAHADLSTLPAYSSRDYCLAVARLGIQAARALHHAHERGIVHRDIKPGNLMVSATGKLWITDFGLARMGSDAGLTLTGDLLGTIRYMAPEQALGQNIVDHRVDVYSLGITLYELLALRPAFEGNDHRQLLNEIAVSDPKPLRVHNTAIRADLGTIVAKAIAKQPSERYQSAGELADDLERFVDYKPIVARPPTLANRIAKWSLRHQSTIWATTAALLLIALAIAGSAGWAIRDRQTRQAIVEERILSCLDNVGLAYEKDDLVAAQAALAQAETLLSTSGTGEHVRDRVERWHTDLEMVERLESVRCDQPTMIGNDKWVLMPTAESYKNAFTNYGLTLSSVGLTEDAYRIRNSWIKAHLVPALDDWASIDRPARQTLLALTRFVDDHPWRNRLRDAIEQDNVSQLRSLAEEKEQFASSRLAIVTLTNYLRNSENRSFAIDVLRRMQRNHVNDFWINFTLGVQLQQKSPQEAMGYLIVALSQRPNMGAVHNALGNACFFSEDFERAAIEFVEARRLQPERSWHHGNLVYALLKLESLSEAEQECRKAIRRFPEDENLRDMLKKVGRAQQKLSKSMSADRKATDGITQGE